MGMACVVAWNFSFQTFLMVSDQGTWVPDARGVLNKCRALDHNAHVLVKQVGHDCTQSALLPMCGEQPHSSQSVDSSMRSHVIVVPAILLKIRLTLTTTPECVIRVTVIRIHSPHCPSYHWGFCTARVTNPSKSRSRCVRCGDSQLHRSGRIECTSEGAISTDELSHHLTSAFPSHKIRQ